MSRHSARTGSPATASTTPRQTPGRGQTLQHSHDEPEELPAHRPAAGERNCYRVAAIFAGGTGPFAAPACATTLGDPADDLPGEPEGLRIDSVGSNYVTLEWDAPSLGGAVDYYEYRSHAHAPTRVPGAATRVTGQRPATRHVLRVPGAGREQHRSPAAGLGPSSSR